jgi:hypothetical protein
LVVGVVVDEMLVVVVDVVLGVVVRVGVVVVGIFVVVVDVVVVVVVVNSKFGSSDVKTFGALMNCVLSVSAVPSTHSNTGQHSPSFTISLQVVPGVTSRPGQSFASHKISPSVALSILGWLIVLPS